MKLLPIGGKNESGKATGLAVNNLGEARIQHQWKAEEISILKQVSITTTDAAWTDRINVSKYATYSLRIFSTLNQPVNVIIARDTGADTTTYLKNFGGSNLGFTIPASSGVRMLTPEEFPFLQYLINFKIRYVCAEAPTQGVLTIEIVGKY